MILKSGDCIPVRTDQKNWATYYGRVVGFNVDTGKVLVVNRDSGGEVKEVSLERTLDFNYYYLQSK